MEDLFAHQCILTVVYDQTLQEFTCKPTDHPVVSDGSPIEFLLQSIFIEYPGMEEAFPPGKLGILINGLPPVAMQPLRNGDIIHLIAFGKDALVLFS